MKQQQCRDLLSVLENDSTQVRASLYMSHPARAISTRSRRRSRLREFERLRSEVEAELSRTTGGIPQWWAAINWAEVEEHALHSGVVCFASSERQVWMNAPALSRSFGIVADSYHLKPILNWLQNPKGFILLSLKEDSIQAFRVGLCKMTRIMNLHGGGDMALRRLARDRWEVPVVLTGSARLVHEARRLGRSWVIAGEIDIKEGIPSDSVPSPDLHALILKKHEIITRRVRSRKVERFLEASKTGRGTDNLSLIREWVADGRIETMYIDESRLIRNWRPNEVPQDDLLDDLAEEVIAANGNVIVLPTAEMPSASPCAALLRRGKPA